MGREVVGVTWPCEERGCGRPTRDGKSFCDDHVGRMPYALELARQTAELEEELQQARRGRAVRVDGLLVQEILSHLQDHGGAASPEALGRHIELTGSQVDALARRLAREGCPLEVLDRPGNRMPVVIRVSTRPKPAKEEERMPPQQPKTIAFGRRQPPAPPVAPCTKCGQTKPIKARGMCGACLFAGFELKDRVGTPPAKAVEVDPEEEPEDEDQEEPEEPEEAPEEAESDKEEEPVIARVDEPAPAKAPTGEEIKAWRDLHGVSQAQLAQLVGARQAEVSGYERGAKTPEPERAQKIAAILAGGRPEGLPLTRPVGPLPAFSPRGASAPGPKRERAKAPASAPPVAERDVKPENVLAPATVPPELRAALGWLARGLDRAARVLERLAAGPS